MPKKLSPKSDPFSDPNSVKVKLGWLEVSGSGTGGVIATVILVIVILTIRLLPVW